MRKVLMIAVAIGAMMFFSFPVLSQQADEKNLSLEGISEKQELSSKRFFIAVTPPVV